MIPLSIADRAGATDAVRDIVDVAGRIDGDKPFVRAGIATLCSYVERAGLHAEAAAFADAAVERCVAGLARGEIEGNPRLAGGMAGVGWLLHHVLDPADADAVCSIVDRELEQRLAHQWNAEYDLARGLVGFGVYALARDHRALAATVLAHLERTAERAPNGARWLTPATWIPEGTPDRCARYDLGMSHGIAGVIGLLARYVKARIEPARSRRLLEDAVGYLLATAPRGEGPRFATYVRVDDPTARPQRFAWCYGDPGIALALAAAAGACERDDWMAEVRSMADGIAAFDTESPDVATPGLCHGAAGLAHVCHRLARALDDARLAEAAGRWIRRALAMRRDRASGFAGFGIDVGAGAAKTFTPALALLSGAPGIALALLAAVTEIEPEWDELFLFGAG